MQSIQLPFRKFCGEIVPSTEIHIRNLRKKQQNKVHENKLQPATVEGISLSGIYNTF
jgi:hypothetical protein